MNNHIIEYVIRIKDAATPIIQKATNAFETLEAKLNKKHTLSVEKQAEQINERLQKTPKAHAHTPYTKTTNKPNIAYSERLANAFVESQKEAQTRYAKTKNEQLLALNKISNRLEDIYKLEKELLSLK